MDHIVVRALRAVTGVLLAGSVVAQAGLLASLTIDLDEFDGELARQRVPIVVFTVVGIATAQVVLACVWRLVAMVRRGTVFSSEAFRYVHIVIGAFIVGAALVLALAAILTSSETVPPGGFVLMGGVGVAVLGVVLILLVMRMLLAQATQMRAELAEVI